jgi:phage gp29-like protein
MSIRSRIADLLDRARALAAGDDKLPRSAPLGRLVATQPPVGDRWVMHPGHDLNPQRIVRAYANAEIGFPAMQCDLFDDIVETDGHLRSQMESRLRAVLGKPWIVQPGGDDPEDARAAEMFDQALRGVEVKKLIEHQLTANWYGYAASEIEWVRDGGLTIPRSFVNVSPRRIRFDALDAPRLLTADAPVNGVELEAGRWIYSRRQHRTNARAGLLRTACWWAYFKKATMRDWLIFSSRFGIPYVHGKYDQTATEEDKKVLEQAVRQLGSDGAAIFSTAAEIAVTSLEFGGRSGDVQGAITARCDAEISKLITGGTLTSGEGTSTGSYALGQVHAEVRFDLIEADASGVGDQIACDLGRAFVAFNGLKGRPPMLRGQMMRDVDPTARIKIFATAVNELRLPVDTEQVYAEFHLKKPPTPERKIAGIPDPLPAGPSLPGGAPNQ